MNFWDNLAPVFITLSNLKNSSDQFLKPFSNELEKGPIHNYYFPDITPSSRQTPWIEIYVIG